MLFLSVIHHYFLWHYTRAFGEIFHVWCNLLWFVLHFFSIPQLARSWIAPWKRMVEGRGNKWNFEDLAGYLVIGFLSRLIGFILRTIIIVVGLVCLTITILGGFVTYVFWILAPIAIAILLVSGITLLFA